MKKLRRVLTLVLLLSLALFAQQASDQGTMLIDSARNAALKFKINDKADGEGTFDLAGDFVKGLNTVNVNVKLPEDAKKDIGDLSGALYGALGDVAEVVGKISATVPQDSQGDMPKKLDGDIEWVLSESKAYAKGKLDLEAPSADQVPKITIDGTTDGNGKNFNGKLNFSVGMGEQAKDVSATLKSFQLTLSEKDNLTTLVVAAAVPASSPAAAQLKQVGQNPDQVTQGVKQALAQGGVQVEKVEISEFKDNPDVSGKLTIVLKDWRGTVSTLLTAGLSRSGDAQKMDMEKIQGAVKQILEAKFDNLDIKVAMDGDNLKGSIDSKIANMQSLLMGYYDVIGMVAESQLKDQADSADMGTKLALTYQTVAFDEARKALQLWADSGTSFKGTGKLTVEGSSAGGATATPNANGAANEVKVTGDFNVDFENFGAYIQKAQAANYPVGKNSAGKLEVELKDGNKIEGELYGYSDAKVADYYKRILSETLKKGGAPEEAVKTVDSVNLKDGKLAFSINKDAIQGAGYLETTDLSPVVDTVMKQTGAEFQGQPLGYSVNGKLAGGQMTGDGGVYFAKLMEGKSAADVKEAFGGAEVKENAKPEEVKLVAVSKPEVKMPGELVAVQTEGKAMLASNPVAAVAQQAKAAAGGGNNLMWIGAGVLGLIAIGAGLAAGKKKE